MKNKLFLFILLSFLLNSCGKTVDPPDPLYAIKFENLSGQKVTVQIDGPQIGLRFPTSFNLEQGESILESSESINFFYGMESIKVYYNDVVLRVYTYEILGENPLYIEYYTKTTTDVYAEMHTYTFTVEDYEEALLRWEAQNPVP